MMIIGAMFTGAGLGGTLGTAIATIAGTSVTSGTAIGTLAGAGAGLIVSLAEAYEDLRYRVF